MQQYRLEFFKNHYDVNPAFRELQYVHHTFVNDLPIDDDYISTQTTSIEIEPTDLVKTGHILRVLRDNKDYFLGIVTDVSPGEYVTSVAFKPFIAIFDEDILFDVTYQYFSSESPGLSLESTLSDYITKYYIQDPDPAQADPLQYYPMSIILPEGQHRIYDWNMNIASDSEDDNMALIGFYRDLIVRALKEYGVAIRFKPDFSLGTIEVTIGRVRGAIDIDANLDNVTVKSFKVNDRPAGINKLIVTDTLENMTATFFVHPNMTWDISNSNRITPVVRGIRTITIDGSYSDDPATDFALAAYYAAHEELGGLVWDNYMELECAPDDVLVQPDSLQIGQQVTVHYKGGAYTSILTGRIIRVDVVSLLFGSERISYTKKNR